MSRILFTGGGGCLVQGGVPGTGGVCCRGGAWPGGSAARGVGVWSRGCLVWGVPGLGGVCGEPPVTATAAGGTHPTGMHSCLVAKIRLI